MSQFEELLSGVRSSTVTDISILVRELRVKVGVLSKFVTIRIYQHPDRAEPYTFEISSVMKPSDERDAREGTRASITENEALRRAMRMLTQDYEEAVRRGEMPDEAWLVEPAVASRK